MMAAASPQQSARDEHGPRPSKQWRSPSLSLQERAITTGRQGTSHGEPAGRLNRAALRRPARTPCPARRGWRAWGCGEPGVPGEQARPARPGARPRRVRAARAHRRSPLPRRPSGRPAGLAAGAIPCPQLGLELAPTSFQPVGDLGKQVVAILDPRPDIARTVLKFALALEIEGVEQHLGHRLRDPSAPPAGQQGFAGFPDSSAVPANPQQQAAVLRPSAGREFPESGWLLCLLSEAGSCLGPASLAGPVEESGPLPLKILDRLAGLTSKEF